MKPGHTTDEPQDADFSPARRVLRTLARVLLQPLALTLILQPALYAAPSPSLLSQWPQFMESSASSNVVFLMDDSTSMLDMQLPIPPGITPAAGGPWTFTLDRANPITGAMQSSPQTREDWILRSPTLNPAYYNPTITYEPWNNDGDQDLPYDPDPLNPPTFKRSDISVTIATDGFLIGHTGHDPRYRGPNYTSSTAATRKHNQALYTGGYGADALHMDDTGVVTTAFDGPNPGADNQDIFSRRLARTSGVCSAWDTTAVRDYDAPAYCQDSSTLTPSVQQWSPVDCSTGDSTGVWQSTDPGSVDCPAANEGAFVTIAPKTRFACTSGTLIGASYSSASTCCPGTVIDPPTAPTLCDINGITGPVCPCTAYSSITNCPVGQTCTSVDQWVTNPNTPVLAHYYRYVGSNSPADKGNPANYVMVEIERYDDDDVAKPSTHLFKVYTTDGTPVSTDLANAHVRKDCTAAVGTTKACTWTEEAQNFANWYTYYRTRLFSAIAVTAEALSGLKATNGLDTLRLGYGAINYFNQSKDPFSVTNPWSFNPVSAPTRTVSDVDPLGQNGFTPRAEDSAGFVSNEGAITRGVRVFNQGSIERKQVFEWLFSIRAQGATPNREALDSVGRYFARKDAWGPWSSYPGAEPFFDARPVTRHESCRRSYTILVTDGEWTNRPSNAGLVVQPLLENRGAPPSWVASQAPTTPLDAASDLSAPYFPPGSGTGKAALAEFPPTSGAGVGQPQFSTVTGAPTNTLSDSAYYWWSRDLRPDLPNAVRPQLEPDDSPEKRNESFWQNVTPYVVGYGLNATMDLPATRDAIVNRTAVTWPAVDISDTVTRDDLCAVMDINGNPSGCGRINDTFRAARIARGDFLVATNIEMLARKVAEAFASVSEFDGTATSFAGARANLRSGDLLYTSTFKTNRWSSKIEAFDALALNDAVLNGLALPAPVATSHFSGSRNIFLSDSINGSAALLAPSDATQQALLGGASEAQLKWVSGIQTVEMQNGGALRDRGTGNLLGDIVNSQAIYSKAHNAGYTGARRPAAASVSSGTHPAADYPQFVQDNESDRPAALYVGANDGMLHAFNASDLSERFAYIPRAVHADIPKLTAPNYVHQYYVDGPVVIGDAYIGGEWRTVLVGTTGNGPAGIFALDVTQRSGSTAQPFSGSDVLWDLAATDVWSNTEHLGHITQPGVIGSGPDGRWYYFVGNGWESQEDKARLLAIDLKTGAIKTFAVTEDYGGPDPAGDYVTAGAGGQPNGLGGVTPVYDGRRNIVAIYAGDRHGRLWKFDFSGTTPGTLDAPTTLTASVKKLFTAADATNKRQSITAAPRVVAHPFGGRLIVFGTGRLTESADIDSMDVQSIYAVWEKKPFAPSFTPLRRAALHQLAFSQTGTAAARDRVRTVTNLSGLDWNTVEGWYIDLIAGGSQVGERVVVAPVSDSGFVELASFEPVAGGDRCQGGGASFRYCFDVERNFKRPCFLDSGGTPLSPNAVATETVPSISGIIKLKVPSPSAANPGSAVTLKGSDIPANPADRNKATGACDTFGGGGGGGPGNGGFVVGIGDIDGKRNASIPCEAVRTWRDIPRN